MSKKSKQEEGDLLSGRDFIFGMTGIEADEDDHDIPEKRHYYMGRNTEEEDMIDSIDTGIYRRRTLWDYV